LLLGAGIALLVVGTLIDTTPAPANKGVRHGKIPG
jgi:hypothetical protein